MRNELKSYNMEEASSVSIIRVNIDPNQEERHSLQNIHFRSTMTWLIIWEVFKDTVSTNNTILADLLQLLISLKLNQLNGSLSHEF